ncbi:peroxidasin homolog pxn-1 [Nephila pilipes]|uniref:Peroxidasin homolog pxn-1 n=1 Tax=Nephila pilipes TaxID=299642 RepID=A0A8X6M9B5_NEPPI|nr:peroxidasin homolog pxn-1 [Nephila pilipes]
MGPLPNTDHVELRDESFTLFEKFPLRETYLNPSLLYNGGLDDVVRGMFGQKAQHVHRFTTEEIRGRLMQRFFQNHGYDLTAMSIQRGRDHGIPPYLQWRKFCNLPIPDSWEDLKEFMKEEYVDSLRDVYLAGLDFGHLNQFNYPKLDLGRKYT